jgi:hypothetical protein
MANCVLFSAIVTMPSELSKEPSSLLAPKESTSYNFEPDTAKNLPLAEVNSWRIGPSPMLANNRLPAVP